MLLELFCEVDTFVNTLPQILPTLTSECGKKMRNRQANLCLSEVLTILIYFHFSRYRTFKDFYLQHVCTHLRKEFPGLISYSRFLTLSKNATIPMLFFMNSILGKCTGISFIDSTKLVVCHNKRILRNKVFKGLAARGMTTMGWFYGFKLHLVTNDKGEIIAFHITKGNVDDRAAVGPMAKKIMGKLFGDKGYLSAKLFEQLYEKGIQLITTVRKNMRNKFMPMFDRIMLRKRAIIEPINDKLKNECQIDHTRHRSPMGFLLNLLSGLVCYQLGPKKPSLKMEYPGQNSLVIA